MTHFFHQLHISFSFPWCVSVFSQNRGLKRGCEFSFRISFSIKILCLPGETVRLGQSHLQTLRLSGSGERESRIEKSDRPTRRDERGAGRAILTSLAPSDPVSGFLLSGNGECGWKGSGALPPPFRRFRSQTRPLCRHTPSHIPLNCARQQVNTHSSPGRSRGPLHLISSPTAAEKL